jgi:hypothetical protein
VDPAGSGGPTGPATQELGLDENLTPAADQIAVLVEAPDLLTVR